MHQALREQLSILSCM